jgi:hypothetical protein
MQVVLSPVEVTEPLLAAAFCLLRVTLLWSTVPLSAIPPAITQLPAT